ncbi:MAG: signal peptide peptidase SppA [Pseudomonadota bacterium]
MNTQFGETERSRLTVWSFFRGFAKVVIGGALLLQAVLFLIVFAVILSVLGGVTAQLQGKNDNGPSLRVEDGSALIFNPEGVLSELEPDIDPVQQALQDALGGGSPGQVSVHKLVRTLEAAAEDERITTLILDLGDLIIPSAYTSKAHILADAVEAFRETGKRVVAVGDNYGQLQYLVASEADTVLMHEYGLLIMSGYGRYRTYYSSLLENLDVTKNIFRVGTYKSALEPILRDDMSPEAEQANIAYLSVLWDSYTARVDENRGLGNGTTAQFANQLPEALRAAGGDYALAAAEGGYIDQLADRATQRAFLVDLVGEDDEGELNAVGLKTYQIGVGQQDDRPSIANVAIVPVVGPIVMGDQEPGVASGDFVASQLRDALEDENVAAVVLRVDSPGGSVFASELIRDGVMALQAAGKPVVASMSSMAASGGYWVSAPADRIFAQPTTITGSIGIFAYVPTFENLAARFGVYTDGVGTTPVAGINAFPIAALPEQVTDMAQVAIEDGYEDFLSVVAEGRDLSMDRVNEIGQGRVWIGQTARSIALVDEFGGLRDAADAAAALAELEDYDLLGVEKPKSQFELFLENLAGSNAGQAVLPHDVLGRQKFDRSTLGQALKHVEKDIATQASLDDPAGMYIRCLVCEDL